MTNNAHSADGYEATIAAVKEQRDILGALKVELDSKISAAMGRVNGALYGPISLADYAAYLRRAIDQRGEGFASRWSLRETPATHGQARPHNQIEWQKIDSGSLDVLAGALDYPRSGRHPRPMLGLPPALVAEQSGLSEEQHRAQEKANAASAAIEKQRAAALRAHADELKKARSQLVEDAKGAIKAEQQAEKDAIKALERIKQERLSLEEVFNDSIARTRSGASGDSEPNYMQAVSLKAKSRQSLVDGDSREAIEQAKQALQVLEQLETAGANTYGFAGFKAELRDLALAAKDLEKTEAETQIADIGTKLAELKQQADDLEKVDITPTLSQGAAAAVTAQLKALAETLGQTLVIPVQLVPPGRRAGR